MICVISESCNMTGLTDDLKQNFKVMKDLSAHTRQTPDQRLATMKKFVDSVNRSEETRPQLAN